MRVSIARKHVFSVFILNDVTETTKDEGVKIQRHDGINKEKKHNLATRSTR